MKHPRWMPLFSALLRGCLFFLLAASAFAQRTDHSVAIYGGFIDDAQIFLSPQSPDPVQRQQTRNVGASYSGAVSWRYRINPTLALQLRGEYLVNETENVDAVGTMNVDGFHLAMFESSALFSLPFSTRRFDMYVGGGVGLYGGKRVYSIAGSEAEHISGTPAFGIHVLLGAEYLFAAGFALRFEVLFRDPQMGVENRFTQPSVTSHGVTYPLQTEPFRSNINLNGNVYALGLCYYF
ncbi:MAG: outer membrane beta-barrel protein [Bacteroidetes bacterium]|nr:outer membrane beta-barrel protein [Bacteroidota bacterium]